MTQAAQGLVKRLGRRGAKAAIVISGFIYFALIVGGGALIFFDGLSTGHALRATVVVGLALLALFLWLRIVLVNWRAIDAEPQISPAQFEETGVWGVGGPAMREPGSTGVVRSLRDPDARQK